MQLHLKHIWNTLRQRGSKLVMAAAVGASLFVVDPAAAGTETMTDRCSANVSFPTTSYGARPDSLGAVVLVRPESGYSEWTPPFTVKKSGSGRIRWWCASTTGNTFDLGTWRAKFDLPKTLNCTGKIVGKIIGDDVEAEDFKCITEAVNVQPGASAYNGWTPERSRCNDRSNKIRARLGPNRLLQIQCLGKTSSTIIAPELSSSRPSLPTYFHYQYGYGAY